MVKNNENMNYINSIIGEGSLFKGEFNVNGLLRIDGDFIGDINTDGRVLIGVYGRVESKINASVIVIGGVVRGNIIATQKITVLNTGIVLGNITAPRLVCEEEGIIHGEVFVNREVAASIGNETGTLTEAGTSADFT